MGRYNEIFRLKAMLEQAGIPFEFYDRTAPDSEFCELYQIAYPELGYNRRVFSVLEGCATYGNNVDLLEVMSIAPGVASGVHGWQTAADVFAQINEYHQKYVVSRRTKQPR